MAWKDWPPHERNFKSDMDQVFFDKWLKRLEALRVVPAARCPFIDAADKETITSSTFTTLNPRPVYIWIPPYTKYLVTRWYQQLQWDGSTLVAICEGRVSVGSFVGTTVRTIISDDVGLLPIIDGPLIASANEWAFAKGSIIPHPVQGGLTGGFTAAEWDQVYEVKFQVRTSTGCVNTRAYNNVNIWQFVDEEFKPNYEGDFAASEF